ncbi:autotransporter outer membrane beta-barrel domain-containing protein [Campylobacter sp. RM12654]|uniref:autotransporter outer membrane beta-barrel domain-containing protein n=1 Tax=Campylobacter sp. RM12654 TaxID=2735738 RepID=UPI0030146651|nr:autotransporter outer membrane beta-barrel domain-containing protein [Campylobacter sp. RM12654]
MKKVLFSSVCAVALLGTNVYAVENSLSNSLETFLSQKTELESKIKEQNTLIDNANKILTSAKDTKDIKQKAYDSTVSKVKELKLEESNKESLKNKINVELQGLTGTVDDLSNKNTILTSTISDLEIKIKSYEIELPKLDEQLKTAKQEVVTIEKKRNEAHAKVLEANKQKNELVKKEDEIGKEHLALQEKFQKASEEEKILLKDQLQAKETELNEAKKAINDLDEKNKDILIAGDLADKELSNARLKAKELENQKYSTEQKQLNDKSLYDNKKLELANIQKDLETKTAEKMIAKSNLEQAVKDYEDAKLAVANANKAQADALAELDLANINLNEAINGLNTANKDLENLKKELESIEANITNNTEEGKKVKDQLMSSGIYTANTQTHANALISLAASHNGDLSNAAPEVKAQAQTLANQIATTILDEKKDDITAEALSTLNVQINNMNKRLGEVRGLNADIGTWFRIYGGRFSNGNNNFNYYSTQIGADKKTSLNNADILAGVLFGYDKINAGVRAKDTSVGAYLSYIHNDGYFADLVLKYIRSSYDSKFVDVKSQNSFLVSAEGGYRFNVNNNFYLEPSLEIITGYIGKYESSLKIFNKFKINVDAHSPLIFKPQIFAGYSVNDFTFRAGVGAVIDTQTKEADLLIGDIIKGVNAKVKSKLGASDRGFVSVGTAYTFSDNLRLNLSVERSFGTKLTNDYEINSTIRYTF